MLQDDRVNRRRSWTSLLLLLLALALRLYRLDSVPPAINQDEAVHAYDVWCLLETGHDHYGESWPIFFRAFRDYHPGPYVYLLMPLQAVFGMNVWTTRLPAVLMGSLAVWLLYQLMRRLYGDRVATLAALFLAVSPWHVHLSRLAFVFCPTFIVLAMLLLVVASRRREAWLWLICGVAFGLISWTYHAMRVFIPLLLIGIALIYRARLRRLLAEPEGRRSAAAWVAGLLIGLGPFLWAWAQHPEQVWARASSVSIFTQATGVFDIVAKFAHNYAQNLSPSFLFIRGDHSLIQSVGSYGQLHYYCAILIPIGLYRAIRRWREEPFSRLAIWWMLVAPIPASFALWESGHSLRSIGSLPSYQILAALGADFALTAIQKRSPIMARRCLMAGAAVVILNFGYFLKLFFVDYPVAAAQKYQAEWPEVFAEVNRRGADYDAVLFTTYSTNQLGMLYLYWNKVPPETYFAAPRRFLSGRVVDRLLQIGRVAFSHSEDLYQMAPMLVEHGKMLVAERPGVAVPGRELRRFNYPDGRLAVILYEVRLEDIRVSSTTTAPTQ